MEALTKRLKAVVPWGYLLVTFLLCNSCVDCSEDVCDVKMWYLELMADGAFIELTPDQNKVKEAVEKLMVKKGSVTLPCYILTSYEEILLPGTNEEDQSEDANAEEDKMMEDVESEQIDEEFIEEELYDEFMEEETLEEQMETDEEQYGIGDLNEDQHGIGNLNEDQHGIGDLNEDQHGIGDLNEDQHGIGDLNEDQHGIGDLNEDQHDIANSNEEQNGIESDIKERIEEPVNDAEMHEKTENRQMYDSNKEKGSQGKVHREIFISYGKCLSIGEYECHFLDNFSTMTFKGYDRLRQDNGVQTLNMLEKNLCTLGTDSQPIFCYYSSLLLHRSISCLVAHAMRTHFPKPNDDHQFIQDKNKHIQDSKNTDESNVVTNLDFKMIDDIFNTKKTEYTEKLYSVEMQLLKLENKLLSDSLSKNSDASTYNKMENQLLKLENELLKLNQTFAILTEENNKLKEKMTQQNQDNSIELRQTRADKAKLTEFIENATMLESIITNQQSKITELTVLVRLQADSMQNMDDRTKSLEDQNRYLYEALLNQSRIMTEMMQNIDVLRHQKEEHKTLDIIAQTLVAARKDSLNTAPPDTWVNWKDDNKRDKAGQHLGIDKNECTSDDQETQIKDYKVAGTSIEQSEATDQQPYKDHSSYIEVSEEESAEIMDRNDQQSDFSHDTREKDFLESVPQINKIGSQDQKHDLTKLKINKTIKRANAKTNKSKKKKKTKERDEEKESGPQVKKSSKDKIAVKKNLMASRKVATKLKNVANRPKQKRIPKAKRKQDIKIPESMPVHENHSNGAPKKELQKQNQTKKGKSNVPKKRAIKTKNADLDSKDKTRFAKTKPPIRKTNKAKNKRTKNKLASGEKIQIDKKEKAVEGPRYQDPHYTGHKDCYSHYQAGRKRDTSMRVRPVGWDQNVDVFCDMKNGGWTLIMRRQDGSTNFFREWQEYKKGFGGVYGEHWLGNDIIHRITNQGHYTLRIDMMDWDRNKVYAEYDVFMIDDEKEGYKLHISGYNGTAGDSFLKHNGFKFSTKDVDNDLAQKEFNGSCANRFSGAWWYFKCYSNNLTGKYYKGGAVPEKQYDGVTWKAWKGSAYSLKKIEMKIRPKIS